MSEVLVVINDFGDYKKGQRIEDEAEIQKILESEFVANTVKSTVPDEKK